MILLFHILALYTCQGLYFCFKRFKWLSHGCSFYSKDCFDWLFWFCKIPILCLWMSHWSWLSVKTSSLCKCLYIYIYIYYLCVHLCIHVCMYVLSSIHTLVHTYIFKPIGLIFVFLCSFSGFPPLSLILSLYIYIYTYINWHMYVHLRIHGHIFQEKWGGFMCMKIHLITYVDVFLNLSLFVHTGVCVYMCICLGSI